MLVDEVPLYQAWDLNMLKLPKRSHLYSLKPLGIGTPGVESLTSYVARLANAHDISVSTLLRYEIAPWFLFHSQPRRLSQADAWEASFAIWRRNPRLLQETTVEGWLDGNQRVSQLVGILKTLTLRKDLAYLTLLPWHQFFSLNDAFHTEPFWCPVCYQEWRESDKICYDPLMWSMEGVDVCPQHHCYLQFWCLYCRQPQPFLRLDTRLGYCSSCRAWLGRVVKPTGFSKEASEEAKWLFWCAEAIGQLLAAVPSLEETSSNRPRQGRKPRLITFLKQCYKLGISCIEGLHLVTGSRRAGKSGGFRRLSPRNQPLGRISNTNA